MAAYLINMPPIPRKGEDIVMKKVTTTINIHSALTNGTLEVTKAEIYYKSLGTTETVNANMFCENLDFLCESGVFADCIGWHYERDHKSNGYIVECGRMNPDSEIIVAAYLSVCEGVSGEDVKKVLSVIEEE